MRVALFLFEWRWSHSFVNRGRGERRAALPKLGRDRTNALIAVADLFHRRHNHASLQTTADCMVPGGASRDNSLE